MSHWNEARGVYDDVCYLRQAHLFQRFGLGGFDTDISRDDDHYLALKLKEVGFPTWNDVTTVPCHTPMPATKKLVLQYLPGTGMVLALFPPGYQVIPLYVTATLIVFGFALFGIISARSVASVLLAGAFGCLAVYLMINPSKASYSMAPTMVACAAAVSRNMSPTCKSSCCCWRVRRPRLCCARAEITASGGSRWSPPQISR